jgi:hypothetical protein
MNQAVFAHFHTMCARSRQGARPAELQESETQIVHALCKAAYLRFRDSKAAAPNL